jgi:hypothetical protein
MPCGFLGSWMAKIYLVYVLLYFSRQWGYALTKSNKNQPYEKSSKITYNSDQLQIHYVQFLVVVAKSPTIWCENIILTSKENQFKSERSSFSLQ